MNEVNVQAVLPSVFVTVKASKAPVTDEQVRSAAYAMTDAWCYAPRNSPDWVRHFNVHETQYLTQARAALESLR